MIETILKRDRAVISVSLGLLTGLAWLYLALLAPDMGDTAASGVMALRPWTTLDFVLMFLMWAVMMIGMMVPGAAPMILMYAAFARRSREQGHLSAPVGLFVLGYIVIWTAFSFGATALQWGLERVALLSPMMVSTSPALGGGLLIAAGVYQWTPIKDVCLRHCQTPFSFVALHWRPGRTGAFRMGVEHGFYCVGCCWVLMALLFLGGVMNLLWIAAIAAFVLVEKLAPLGRHGGRLMGVLMAAAGLFVVVN